MLGAEVWTFMSGSLPGWLILLSLVFLYYFFGIGSIGFNSASSARVIYDSLYEHVFPYVSHFRRSFTGSVLRFHYGPRCRCKHSYGFMEYFIYPGDRVGHVGKGGISLERFLESPGLNPDIMIIDCFYDFGSAFKEKVFTFTTNFILRVSGPDFGYHPDFRYVYVDDAWLVVSNTISDEQCRLLYVDRGFCGSVGKYSVSPTDSFVRNFSSVSDSLVRYLEDKTSLFKRGVFSSLQSIEDFYGSALRSCNGRTVDIMFVLVDMIDWCVRDEPAFNKQVMFDMLLVKRDVRLGDKSYNRERHLAGLLSRIVVLNKKRRKRIFLALERYFYRRDSFGPNVVIGFDVLDQEFFDYKHAACQDYDEISC